MPRPTVFATFAALALFVPALPSLAADPNPYAAPAPPAAPASPATAAAERSASYIQMAQVFEQAGQFDRAMDQVDRLIQLSPNDADGYFWKARLQREKGDFENAIFNYRRGFMIDPTRRAQASWNIAYSNIKWSEALEKGGELNAAIDQVKAAIATLEAMQTDAQALAALREVDFRKTLQADRDRLQMLQQNQHQGDLAAARDAVGRAQIFYDRGKIDVASRELQNAIDLDPENAEAWKDLGKCLSASKEFDKSAEACRKAIAINPNYKEAWNNLAVDLDELKKYSEAIDAYNKALAIDPTYVRALTNMGETYQKMGDYPKATDSYARAIKVEPGNPIAHFDLAGVDVLMKNYDSAIAHLRELLKSDPANLNACSMIGDISLIVGKPDDAVAAYQKALIIAPNDPAVRDGLAKAVQRRDSSMLGKYFRSTDMVEPAAGAAPKAEMPTIPAATVKPILPPPAIPAAPASSPDGAPVSAPPRYMRIRDDSRTTSYPMVFH